MRKIFTLALVLAVAAASLSAQYKVNITWDNPGAVGMYVGSFDNDPVQIPADATSYEFDGAGTVYFYPLDGYVLTSIVKSTTAGGKSENISGNYDTTQLCSVYVSENLDGGSIKITTKKLDYTAAIPVNVINGAEYLKTYINASWTNEDGSRIEYNMPVTLQDGTNNVEYDPEYARKYVIEPVGGTIVRSIFSVKANDVEIDGGYNKNSFVIQDIKPTDSIEIRVFENEAPVIEYVTLTVDFGENMEGCIYSIRDWTINVFSELKDNKLELIKGTDIQFNFNRDYTFTDFKLGSEDIFSKYSADNNNIRFKVEESTTFTIEGTAKVYADVDFTVYAMNPEGIRIARGQYGSVYNPISDIAEGAPISEDITTPPVTATDIDGNLSSLKGSIMTPENTKVFTLSVSERNPYIYAAPMPGYYIEAMWNHDMSENMPYATFEGGQGADVLYIIAKKINTDYQASVELIGSEPVVFAPSQLFASKWENKIPSTFGLNEGEQIINFDPVLYQPFSVRTLVSFNQFAVYIDGLKLTANENGVYSVNFYTGESALVTAENPMFSHLVIYADKSQSSSYGNVKITARDKKTLDSTYSDLNLKTPENASFLAGTKVSVRPVEEQTLLTLNGEIIYGYDSEGKLVNKLTDGAYTFSVEKGKNYIFESEEDLYIPTEPSDPSGVNEINTDPTAPALIYNLEGVCLGSDWKSLPAGIYIVNGEKRLKK